MGIGILPIHQRLAELWTINKRRQLTPAEMGEVQHCLAENVKYVWRMAYLENASLMASMTADMDWQHEICREIDELQDGNRKKPGSKKRNTD
jgi:hypothetical protein